MGANIKLNKNVAHIKGVRKINGMDLFGSDLRSSAALIIAGIIAKGSSKIYGLEHLDRGYENFELKLKKLGIEISRETSKSNFKANEFIIEPRTEAISKVKAA
jgi:UDP-N-acetylglucosamine 1-carboxyvinyltransferase